MLRLARGKREAAAFAIGCGRSVRCAPSPACVHSRMRVHNFVCLRACTRVCVRTSLCACARVPARVCACVCLCGGSFQCADGRFTLGSSIPAKFFASQFQKVEDWVLVLSQSSSG